MRQIPLKLVLIVPFVLQIIGAVSLVSYLSYRSGQESVNELITKLRNETTTRVVQYLDNYLATPVLINQINADSVRLGYLDLQNTNKISIYLINQLQKFKNVSHILLGTEQGNFIVANQNLMINRKRTLSILRLDPFKANKINQYLVDQNGKIIRFYNSSSFGKVQERPWYQQAVKAGKPIRVPIFQLSNNYSLSLNSSYPIYNPKTNQLLGVFSAASDLLSFHEFLANLQIGETGRLFIIERNGLLIGTSTNQVSYLRKKEQGKIILKRIKATDFQDSLIQSTSLYLQKKFGSFAEIKHNQSTDFIQDNHRNFVQVIPYQDNLGLDWLIVTVIPESDFMKHIQKNAELTFLLSAITLLAATVMGILTARWITKPIQKLSLASEALAQGNWQEPLPETNNITELSVVVESFKQMSEKLQKVFQESETRFTKIFRFSPYAMSIINLDNSAYLAANDQFFILTGYSKEEVIGHTVDELRLMIEQEQILGIYHLLQTEQETHNYEMMLQTKSGEIKIILLSSELIQLEGQVFVLAILNDISDRKKAEAALKESQHFIEQVANASPQILYILDPITWTNLYVNRQIIEILGYTPEEFQQGGSQIFLDILHPDDLSLLSNNMSFWQTAQDGEILTTEYRMRHKNGSWHWLRSRDVVFARDKNQQVTKVLGTAQDISDRKQQEEQIAQQNSREILLREITQNIRQTLDLNIVFNTAVREVRQFLDCDRVTISRFNLNSNYTEGKIVAESVVLDIHSVISLNIQEYCFHCCNEEDILQYQQGRVQVINDIYEMDFWECYVEFLEESQIRSSVTLPLLNNSRLWGILSIHQFSQPRTWQDSEIDLLKQITDQLAIAIQQANLYQQAQRELAAKNELFLQLTNELNQKKILLKEIHHRVKNNLQILSSLLYLQFRKTSPEIQILSEDYQNRIQSMALIHEQLYRSEDLEQIDFHAYLLNLTTNIFQSYSTNPDLIQLKLNVDKIVIHLDQSVPLGLIIHELVSNAIKHAFPTGQGEIAIALICSGSEFILRVADNGMGISPDIDLQNTDSLGMQLIYSLTEQLQGQVRYTYQAGSHFEIIFPVFN